VTVLIQAVTVVLDAAQDYGDAVCQYCLPVGGSANGSLSSIVVICMINAHLEKLPETHNFSVLGAVTL
jgi:hypothetical protein